MTQKVVDVDHERVTDSWDEAREGKRGESKVVRSVSISSTMREITNLGVFRRCSCWRGLDCFRGALAAMNSARGKHP